MDSSAANAMKILVVDDDSTSLAVVAALLRKLNFQVVTVKDPREALIILGGVEAAGGFDVVIADVHMPEMNGFELQHQITTHFQLPVILMSVDDRDTMVGRGVDFGATLFISKPVSVNDVRKYLCQIAAAAPKKDDQNTNIIPPLPPTDDPAANTNNNNNNNYEITREGEVTFKTNKLTGKKKLVWTARLHYKFLDAITLIGLNNAVPKKILEVMDVPGITREHVASHLQKYRMFLKRVTELTVPSQRNNVDWGFGSGVNLGPRIAAPRRYGGMLSLINNLQTSLGGGGRWNNNITAEEQPPIPMPPAGTFSSSSSSSFLFSGPPRLAAASPLCNQPSWRPGYGTGGRQSSLLLSPHHHQQQQRFNFGLQSSPSLIPARTNMVNPIYQRSFTLLPPLVIRGNINDAIAAASPPVPALQFQGGGGSSMLQPPQTYNNINNNNAAAETTRYRNIEIMVRGAAAAATRPNQLSGRVVEEVPPNPLDFGFLFDINDDDVFKFLLSDSTENQSDDASQNSRPNTCTEGGGNRPPPLFVPVDHDPTVQPQTDLTPPPSHPLHDDAIGTNTATGGDENSNLSNSSAVTTTQYYDDHEDLPSLDQLLLEPRNDEELFLQSVYASMPSVGAAQQHHTSNN
ncbi:PREDICTED: uncharacterized protein LOC109186284 [Ipomoea nil]|uniref:uncharacterized protein LOC109186284 n=1 Tax=Ipomoea nil TaxID=35883 RepID=UPI00090087F0|nr:PREDICTED: uncharacterized protein LOC109186284 [Ipomoea nil]